MKTTYTTTCTCGEFEAQHEDGARALDAAKEHIGLGKGHVVTCTRPAHFWPEGVPVIVFISNPERTPNTVLYAITQEIYDLSRKR